MNTNETAYRSNAKRNMDSPDVVRTTDPGAVWPDSPTLRLRGLLKATSLGRSKAFELMKTDPDFPQGIPLYDSDRSPKFYWTHEVMAWMEARAAKFRGHKEGN
ncbi:AlpA family phage regulatory protein [Stenotrophomonas sp. PS02297]|uniref:helix-turn-helix transcriptional regulator n=1 Tax=unclassified Stenotrophomonas TaxID=196198 RepID=UPI00249A3CCC|nr:AlpA family phage regulatory protein [Stenotrophomonas sp. PS02297]